MGRLGERQIRWLLAGVGIGCFALLLTLEIVTDPDQVTFLDGFFDAVEMLLTIASAVGVALLFQRVQSQHEERMALIQDLKIARAEGEAWRAKVQASLNGIRVEMENQFRAWGMTGAEREVGLLILKGLNHKQIAALRGTSEATVRQQAQAIYRKAALPGKTAFSAYFLEDLFAPERRRSRWSHGPARCPVPGTAAAGTPRTRALAAEPQPVRAGSRPRRPDLSDKRRRQAPSTPLPDKRRMDRSQAPCPGSALHRKRDLRGERRWDADAGTYGRWPTGP